jgi:transcriptional regulator with PAS, ATPase and Fis domain
MPPLRERGGDITLLVKNCLLDTARRTGKKVLGIDRGALNILTGYGWPGNVRELCNVIEYAFVVCQGERIEEAHLPDYLADSPIRTIDSPSRTIVIDTDDHRQQLINALQAAGGNQSKAAGLLGVSRVTVWKWLKRYGITLGANR